MLCHAVSWGKSRQKYWSTDLRSAVESREKNRTHDLDLWYRQSKSAAPGCIWHFTSRHVTYCKSGSLVKFGTLRELSTERTDCRWLTSSERKTAEHGKQTALTHKPQQVVISSAATLHTPVKALCYKIYFSHAWEISYCVMISDSSVWIHSSSQKPNKTRSNKTEKATFPAYNYNVIYVRDSLYI